MTKYMKEFLQTSSNREIGIIVTKMDFCIIDQEEEIKELKQQLTEKDKEIADLHTTINQDIVQIMILKDDIDKRRKFVDEKIVEKDKEIERLHKYLELDWSMTPQRMDGKSMTKRKIIENWEKEIRHQVCEEIKECAYTLYAKGTNIPVEYHIVAEELNNIEKGE